MSTDALLKRIADLEARIAAAEARIAATEAARPFPYTPIPNGPVIPYTPPTFVPTAPAPAWPWYEVTCDSGGYARNPYPVA